MLFNKADEEAPFGNGGLNAYAYCKGDPLNGIDPTGRNPLLYLVGLAGLASTPAFVVSAILTEGDSRTGFIIASAFVGSITLGSIAALKFKGMPLLPKSSGGKGGGGSKPSSPPLNNDGSAARALDQELGEIKNLQPTTLSQFKKQRKAELRAKREERREQTRDSEKKRPVWITGDKTSGPRKRLIIIREDPRR